MKAAIIADIQGNAVALEHVLHHIKQDNIGQIFCLGDLVTGPEPKRVLELLRDHEVMCVRGNMDAVALNPPPPTDFSGDARKFAEIDQWCHQQLIQADQDMLRSLPMVYTIELSHALTGCCFHGSPHSTEGVIDTQTNDQQLADMLNGVDETLLFTGHMHLPMLRTFGDQTIINPGSVGLPNGGKRLMPLQAEYAVIDTSGRHWSVAFHQIKVDPVAFEQRLLNSGMPHAAWYLTRWQV